MRLSNKKSKPPRAASLGFAQRRIQASCSHIPAHRRPQKSFPSALKTLGDRIHAARFEKGLNQTDLAERVGVTVSMIRLWEKNGSRPGERQYRTLESLSISEQELKCGDPTVDRLLGIARSDQDVGRNSSPFRVQHDAGSPGQSAELGAPRTEALPSRGNGSIPTLASNLNCGCSRNLGGEAMATVPEIVLT